MQRMSVGWPPAVLEPYERRAREAVEPHLGQAFEGGDTRLHEAARYHLSRSGKRLRSALVFMVGEHLGVGPGAIGAYAAAVEFAHEASLVLDDLEDGDESRRGQPAVWARFG